MKENIKELITLNSTWLIIGGVTAVLLTGGIIYYRKRKASPSFTPASGSVAIGRTTSSFGCKSHNYPLTDGTCHKDVKILQAHLVKKGFDLGRTGTGRNGVDGQFGAKTKAAALKALGKSVFTLTDINQLKRSLKTLTK